MEQLSLLGAGVRLCQHCGQLIAASKRKDAIYCGPKCTKSASQKRLRASVTAEKKRKRQDRWNLVRKMKRAGTYVSRPLKYSCELDMRLQKRFGISLREWEAQHARQGGCCAICEKAVESRPSHRTHTDHCHATGQFRGILCHQCNTALGDFQDDPELLEKAASYLREATLGTPARAA
jgi:hypothetical protein